ncbi:MAG: protein kinase [Alphaproteobacteria bacterium]|nr:protein kinase [Alphaproteobacteria bacterium]
MLDQNLDMNRRPPTLKDGRYVVVSVLGKGAHAGVYQCWDTRLRTWRAIKVLAHQFLGDAQIRARFNQEAATMARLDHPNLVKVFDISDDQFTPHIVMELCSGGSIIQWMKKHGAFPPRLALEVIIATAEGVAVAHEEGFTHRDIKPQNILIDHKGVIKLTDFGIARKIDSELTASGSTMGTYAFMAPEQRHDSTQVDERADIYSLAATLFTMLKVQTTTELFVAERGDPILQGIPEPVVDVILRAAAYRPADRYPSVVELVTAMRSALDQLDEDPPHAPINALAEPLPGKPPTSVPDQSGFEDLLKSLSLYEDAATVVTGARPDFDTDQVEAQLGEGRKPGANPTILPYYMSRPERTTMDPDERPSYISDPELYAEQQRPRQPPTVDRVIGAEGVVEVERHSRPSEPPAEARSPEAAPVEEPAKPAPVEPAKPAPAPEVEAEPEAGPGREQLVGVAVIAAAVLILVGLVGLAGTGISNVNAAQGDAVRAERALVESVERSTPAIQELGRLGGDPAALQKTYFDMKNAKGRQRASAALAYADDLSAVSAGKDVHPEAQALIDAVGSDADALRDAQDVWRDAASGVSGGLALALGLANPPPP